VIAPDKQEDKYKATRTPVSVVQTDPATAWNSLHHTVKTLFLDGFKAEIVLGDRFADTTRALNISVNGVAGLALKNPIKALEAAYETGKVKSKNNWKDYVRINSSVRDSIHEATVDAQQASPMLSLITPEESKNLDGLVYKGRPLNGIWATAPFLHNGSVPTLWDLLTAPDERPKTFWVGDRTFDPVKVGYRTDVGKNEFKVLNSRGEIQPGNSNLGHDFGTRLTDDEKRALVEYMKIL
jgi:hypothetical protein